MSGSSGTVLPIYTISVGTAGAFTNDSAVDVSAQVNAEIQAAPAGDQIDLIFNPGIYGAANSIRVPSNTSVTGNDSTLVSLAALGSSPNEGLITNSDSYFDGTTTVVNNTTGSPTLINNWTTVETIVGNSGTAIKDTNISVQGMTFLVNDAWMFGTWFTNATNIDVQNNVYIGGVDGNAFVNVVNGIVANNIAVGQYNAAYDNWNGPSNITIEDNQTFTSGTSQSGWSVLVNSTPTGDPSNPGNANNDGVVDNLFSSNWENSFSVNTDALLSYGFSAEYNITQQGNITTGMNIPNSGQIYSTSPASHFTIEDDIFSQLVETSSDPYTALEVQSQTTTQPNVTSNSDVVGNLIVGIQSQNSLPLIENYGNSPVTQNNAVLDEANSNSPPLSYSSFDGNGSSAGNITNQDGQTTGSGITPYLEISAPPTLFPVADDATSISGLAIAGPSIDDSLSVTLITQFGSLSVPGGLADSSITSSGGETTIVLNGYISTVNAELGQLYYTSNSAGWDDSIEIEIASSSGLTATRYIPILIEMDTTYSNQLTTLYPGELIPWQTGTLDTSATLPTVPDLSGDTIIAAAGNNYIAMGSSVNVAFIGSGEDTIEGGSTQEYISLGSGNASLNLGSGGDVTVAGGSGSLFVAALSGNNLIETGAGQSIILAGGGANSVIGGLGNFTVGGGSGSLTLVTLPQDGGNFSATLGTGNATVFALSGNDTIATQNGTSNLIYAGIGSDQIYSAGLDSIFTGAGPDTINASYGGSDSIVGGTGSLYFIGGSGAAVITAVSNSTLMAGAGNLSVMNGNNDTISVNDLDGTTRDIFLGTMPNALVLSGYGSNPILSESMVNGSLTIKLTDGTQISFPDSSSEMATIYGGNLSYLPGTDIEGQMYINLNNVGGINQDNGNNNGSIINGLLSSNSSGLSVNLVSTGLINNGIINI